MFARVFADVEENFRRCSAARARVLMYWQVFLVFYLRIPTTTTFIRESTLRIPTMTIFIAAGASVALRRPLSCVKVLREGLRRPLSPMKVLIQGLG